MHLVANEAVAIFFFAWQKKLKKKYTRTMQLHGTSACVLGKQSRNPTWVLATEDLAIILFNSIQVPEQDLEL